MGNKLLPVPPYEGTEPYIYFAFAEADRARVWRLMRPLLRRGCRIWYCLGAAGSAEALLHRQERAAGAALTLLYLSDAACEDRDTKGFVLVNQKYHRPILCLDPDESDRRLSMNLREDVPHLPIHRYAGDAARENAIIHAEGFSQEMLGEPVRVGGNWLGRLAVLFCVLALLLGGVAFVGVTRLHWFQPEIADAVSFRDPVIEEAAREAALGAPLTEESLAAIRRLRLSAAPESWDDLALLPALEALELPQQALLDGVETPEGYRIELSGGEGG